MICAARADTDPAAVTCISAMGGGKAKCKCREEVEADMAAFWDRVETREARVPDSAREEAR